MQGLLPPNPFFRVLLARATWLWVGMHMASAAGMGAGGMDPKTAMAQSLVAALWIWGFCVLGVHLIARRKGEALILANLGFSARHLGLLVLAWCVALEGCLLLLAGAIL